MSRQTKPRTRLSLSLPIVICMCVWIVCVCGTGCRFAQGPMEQVNARKLRLARNAASISTLGQARVRARPIRRQRRLSRVEQWVTKKPELTPRTQQLLRQYVLDKTYQRAPHTVIQFLVEQNEQKGQDVDLTNVHALVEIASIEGDWQARLGHTDQATRYHATAVLHASRYLFDAQQDILHNAYDPQFRGISDIYNRSLGQLIRVLITREQFGIGNEVLVQTMGKPLSLAINLEGRWQNQSFERFELASDYMIEGLENEYKSYGLGVPVIAVRQQQQVPHQEHEKYYPPGLSLPLTALLHVSDEKIRLVSGAENDNTRVELRLIDPLQHNTVNINGRVAPLECDLTTPMAYYLNDPLLDSNVFATLAMLNADFANNFQGLYMLEPYDPDKIPVVMIHGFWSSPITWLQMFNDLRASTDIREKYQFWFLMYPTGQPFWVSAAQVRDDLARARQDLDPQQSSKALDQMVLVGHSMGGLISKLQTLESGEHFWDLVTDRPFTDVRGDASSLEKLKKIFFFERNPSVKRVITIATPHQGSFFANNTTRWLSRQTFALPQMTAAEAEKLVNDNYDIFNGTEFGKIRTSVDSLTPGAPFIETVRQFDVPANVKLHNIYGVEPKHGLVLSNRDRGDGVVSVSSATSIPSASELEIESEHTMVHQQPKAILEVRRILLDHLVEIGQLEPNQRLKLPAGHLETQPLDIQIPSYEIRVPEFTPGYNSGR